MEIEILATGANEFSIGAAAYDITPRQLAEAVSRSVRYRGDEIGAVAAEVTRATVRRAHAVCSSDYSRAAYVRLRMLRARRVVSNSITSIFVATSNSKRCLVN